MTATIFFFKDGLLKLPFVIKIFVLSIFEWPLKTGFTAFQRNSKTLFIH